MKKLIKIYKYILGSILLLSAVITIFLEEPLYGLGLLLVSIFIIPFTSVKISHYIKFLTSTIQYVLITIIVALILITTNRFGRKEYQKKELHSTEAIAKLSIHPIKKTSIGELDYYYIEKGEGTPILLLHGFPDMANTWDETITQLSKKHRVIAPFLRGYYPTSISKSNDYSVKSIAGDIVILMDKLHIDKCTVLGQDWGASISYSVANLAPQKVEKIVAIAIPHPTCLIPSPQLLYAARHFPILGSGEYGVRYTRKNDFEYIDRLYQRWSPDYKNFQTSSNAIKETFKFPNRLDAALGYYVSFNEEQKTKKNQELYLKQPKVPVLFLVGENDAIATREIINAMNENMPKGSKSIVFKNAGHFLHQEVFSQFIKELKLFLE